MKTEHTIFAYPSFLTNVTGVKSVRLGARFAWADTCQHGVVRFARSLLKDRNAPSAFDVADRVVDKVAA